MRSVHRGFLVGLAALALFACGPTVEPGVTVLVTKDVEPLVADGLRFVGDSGLHAVVVDDPAAELKRRGGAVVALTTRADCTDCYRVDGEGTRLLVSGGEKLGVQYGLWHALELMGYRFLHPWKSVVPASPQAAPAAELGVEHAPEMKKRRGLHLHTLHPIEALYDFWIPGEANLEGAKRTIDFLIKNRGNYIQWAALDDVQKDDAVTDAWRAHTRAITGYAHAHGVQTGVQIQLFGQSNLQNAFDLIDDGPMDPVLEMRRRLHVLLDGNGLDVTCLSFGEFFAADPAAFVDQVNVAYDEMKAAQPSLEVTTLIHVGNYDNLRVTYMGETLLYYFLVKFANPAIVPWIHTTMYYNLYEDAGGAYLHDRFDEHRAFLEAKLAAGQPAGYLPENAYWIAFDNDVPTFLPLYIRSRWLDVDRLAASGHLDDHVIFSTGWEWGYWLEDVAVLRMNYEKPAAWDADVQHVFAAWGELGAKVGALVKRLADVEHDFLIEKRMAAYLAGRDQVIDAGDKLGIFSQPDREEFSEVAALDAAGRAAFATNKLAVMKDFADQLTALDTEFRALGVDGEEPFLSEVQDGFQVTAARARFIHAMYAATVAYADTGSDGGWLAKADGFLADGRAAVAHRRSRLHDPDPKTILRNTANPTFYQYGYLREADSLCFWERERAQARALILQTGDEIPGCVL